MGQNLSSQDVTKKISSSLMKTVLFIALYIIVSAVVNGWVFPFLINKGINIANYSVYVNIPLALIFGYAIVMSVSELFYWNLRIKYDHSTAAGVRNVIKIIGIGALLASIAGGTAGGAAGVALGGFLGMVIGFASQQVLGQAIAGLFLLLVRPFKIGDAVNVAGEEGEVVDIGTMFTLIKKGDTLVYIPNNTLIGQKIYKKQKIA